MPDPIIKVESLSKKYIVDHKLNGNQKHDTLRDTISHGFKSIAKAFSRPTSGFDPEHEEFWALNDVSFEIEAGDRVGIIGRNGAGKSTLLKILSRITEPTRGRVTIDGRVASLLEVGTGFHKELTGRENIFLNGAILGMSKIEIKQRFDEIVAFSGVEKFLDTPVKRYSSGMYVRLAFAVAAHLEPEILIVDEVLAVGDMEFQKKCLAKMEDVSKGGRTVLFVSHNMASIQALCNKGIMLDAGRLASQGKIVEIIDQYVMRSKSLIDKNSLATRKDRQGNGSVRIKNIRFKDMATGHWTNQTISGRDILVEINYAAQNLSKPLKNFNLGLTFHTNDGQFVSVINSRMANNAFDEVPPEGNLYCFLPKLPLMTGNYFVNFNLNVDGAVADKVAEAALIQIEAGDYFGTGKDNSFGRQGVYIQQQWNKNDQF